MLTFEFTEENKNILLEAFAAQLLLESLPKTEKEKNFETFSEMLSKHESLESFSNEWPELGSWLTKFLESYLMLEKLKELRSED